MARKSISLLPKTQKILDELGSNIKLARLRRKLSLAMVAERANISKPRLMRLEKGDPNASIGAYLAVLKVLGLEKDLSGVASDDELGRTLQDLNLSTKERAPKGPTNGG